MGLLEWFIDEAVKSWSTKSDIARSDQRDGGPAEKHRWDYPQINQKVVTGEDAGTHRWYNPSTGQMGEAGPKAERTRNK